MFNGKDIIVLDLETARSAEDCVHCGGPKDRHTPDTFFCVQWGKQYKPIGWDNKPSLGLSIGGYYSYPDDRVYWFDEHCLEDVIACLVYVQPLMVSFNGVQFDYPLMRGILRRRADGMSEEGNAKLSALCDRFKLLASQSYDLLAEIWRADPSRKFERGLNSLDAIAQANGLGPKLSHGAQAPRDWAAGRHADVINYCQDDILKTKTLFEIVTRCQGYLLRGNQEGVDIRWITREGEWAET